MLVDTGSSYLALETTDCPTCYTTYDKNKSPDTFQSLPNTNVTKLLGNYKVKGAMAIDWVCITTSADSCVTDFPWVNIMKSVLPDHLSGILGLCAEPLGPNFL